MSERWLGLVKGKEESEEGKKGEETVEMSARSTFAGCG